MAKKLELLGKVFGSWTVIEEVKGPGRKRWLCRCKCGTIREVDGTSLVTGKSRSCYSKDCSKTDTHGMSRSRIYKVWASMKMRCVNPNDPSYSNYGGRGIKMLQEWLNNPAAFITWALESGYEPGLDIDRIDNDAGYFPENCRWTSRLVNRNNQRMSKFNSSGYTGVCSFGDMFRAYITSKLLGNRQISLGVYKTPEEACQARNKFIEENNLPQRIQGVRDENTDNK